MEEEEQFNTGRESVVRYRSEVSLVSCNTSAALYSQTLSWVIFGPVSFVASVTKRQNPAHTQTPNRKLRQLFCLLFCVQVR